MKNRCIIGILLVIEILFFTACGMSKPPTESDIKNDFTVSSYFDSLGMKITSVTLEKRQTYDEQKRDTAYCYIEAESENAYVKNQFVVTSSYYDEGGWMIEGLYPVEGNYIEPKGYPEIEMSSSKCEILEMDPTFIDSYTYVYNYGRVYKGDYLTCVIPCSIECTFDRETGVWTYTESQGEETYNFMNSYAQYQADDALFMIGIGNDQMTLAMYSDGAVSEEEKLYWKINTYEGITSSANLDKGEDVNFVLNGETHVSELTEFEIPVFRFKLEVINHFITKDIWIYVTPDGLILNKETVLEKVEEVNISACVTMPDLTYKTLNEAKSILESCGLELYLSVEDECFGACEFEEGQITNQSIAPGLRVPKGTKVVVAIDKRWSYGN